MLRTATLACVAALAFAGAAAAQAIPGATEFMLDPAGPAAPEPRTAKKSEPLTTIALRAPRAVRLEAALDAKAANWLGAKLKRPLAAGQVLLGSGRRPGIYCAPIKDGLWYAVAPCLADTDGDGRFDGALTAAFNSANIETLAVADNKTVHGVTYSEIAPLAVPAAYTPVDYRQGDAAEAQLRWKVTRDRKQPEAAPQIAIWWDVSDPDSGTGVFSMEAQAALPGGVGEVSLGGTTVRVLGLQPNGGLRYQVEAAEAQSVTFGFRAAPSVVYLRY